MTHTTKTNIVLLLVKAAAQQQDSVSIPWSVGTGLVASTGAELSQNALNKMYMSAANLKNDGSDLHKSVIDSIKRKVMEHGFDYDSVRPSYSGAKLDLNNAPHMAAADVINKRLHIPDSAHPGIWAHEAGHAFGGKPLMYGQAAGKGSAFLGTLFALLGTRDKNTADNAALVSGGLLGLGTLPSELDASRRGFSMLKNLPFTSRMKSFIGLPTYLAAMLTPYAAVQGKNYMGGYNKSKV